MSECKHERWLYAPSSFGIGDGVFSIDSGNFLCADCGEWVPLGTIEIDKIVNVTHLPKEKCLHDLAYYTLGGSYLCLRCGHKWFTSPTPLHVNIDPVNWKERDKKRREEVLEKFKNGEIL